MQSHREWTSRLYEGEHDLHSMLDLLMQGRALTNDWHYAHVGEMLFNFFMVVCHLDPCKHIRLWHAHSRLVGYAILGEDPSFECQVRPDYEWLGIEAEAIDWAESLLVELRAADPAHWGGELTSGARQDDAPRLQFLEQHGFTYRGRFAEVNMLRSLSEPVPAPELPTGYQVRHVAPCEFSDRAAIERDVWLPWSVGDITDGDYLYYRQMPGYSAHLDVVTVTPGGVIAAYANGWLDPLNRIGDIGPVGAREAYRRQGLTRLALLECLRRMQAYGMDRACISTGIDNTAAQNLYASIGFKPVNRYLDYIKLEPTLG